MKSLLRFRNKNHFLTLWISCIIGAWSVLPYTYALGIVVPDLSLEKLFLLTTLQAVFLYGLLLWICYLLLPKTDLNPLCISHLGSRVIFPGITFGLLVGLTIFILDKVIFNNSSLSELHPPAWMGAIASLYGGINEEVLLRLFLFTLVYFLLSMIGKNRSILLWTTNIFVAAIFGLTHLPLAFKMSSPSVTEIFRILLLNGIAGMTFGWLYWSRSFYTAALAHFVADILIHVLLI